MKRPDNREFFNFILPLIEQTFGIDLRGDPGRHLLKRDIAHIEPDMVLIQPDSPRIYIIENKPYYESTFTGNQGPGEDYIEFVKWLNGKNIRCEYLIIQSCSWKQYKKVKQIQEDLQEYFGVLLLEDIFREMARREFKYTKVSENWSDFTEKGSDCA